MKLLFKEKWHGFGGDGLMPTLSPHIWPDQIRLYHIQLSVWSLGFLRFFELLVEIFLSCLSCLVFFGEKLEPWRFWIVSAFLVKWNSDFTYFKPSLVSRRLVSSMPRWDFPSCVNGSFLRQYYLDQLVLFRGKEAQIATWLHSRMQHIAGALHQRKFP